MSDQVAESTPFPLLLSPLRVGTQVLRNRVIMGSLHTRLEHASDPMARERAFFAERARGGVALIITGGYSPNEAGRIEQGAPIMDNPQAALRHRPITDAVHEAGAKMLLQVIHAGRYAKHDLVVGVSPIKSALHRRMPREMSAEEIERTVDDFARCAELAAAGGYDGIEVMGSEGYLINQFTTPRTNRRADHWGGTLENRIRFPVEIVRRVRARLGPDFIIMYRISAIDLVEDGSTGEEIDVLARAVEQAGANILNTGVGWHEAPVPTIAYMVPRGAWIFATARLKQVVGIPLVASNRINMPETAESILARGEADLVSMARPMLADPEFVNKAREGRVSEINTCIACNQACLDFIFEDKIATCLVNPRACREIEFNDQPAVQPRRVAVVGAGPAGLAFATNAAARGHQVVLFDAGDDIGGQINLARRIPGKTEFNELLRYFRRQIALHRVEVRLKTFATAEKLANEDFDLVVVATGIKPRTPEIEGIDHPSVVSYVDLINGRVKPGRRVAIIGTGGIGYDVAELLLHDEHAAPELEAFFAEWGVDTAIRARGGLRPAAVPAPIRNVTMLQRGNAKPGSRLGVSTGWILRKKLQARRVETIVGASYERIDAGGLHYRVGEESHVLAVDTIVICAGQEPNEELADALRQLNVTVSVIGGARYAAELDALRAIGEGVRLATEI